MQQNEREHYENVIKDMTQQNSKLSQIIQNLEFNPKQTHIIESI